MFRIENADRTVESYLIEVATSNFVSCITRRPDSKYRFGGASFENSQKAGTLFWKRC